MLRKDSNFKKQFDVSDIQIPASQTIYEALARKNLLIKPIPPTGLGLHLVKQGEIGLCMNNGTPEFLAPGRHTLWSPYRNLVDIVSITKDLISLGSIQIFTLKQGEIAWTQKNGTNIILDQPGRYILESPHQFIKIEPLNKSYIQLGTYHRITVPEGFIAIAYNNGKQFIIRPNQKDEQSAYIIDSATFSFDPKLGLQSTKIKEIKLEQLTVNTKENISANVEGVIRYHIAEPEIAFFKVEDVHSAIKLQAEATLTSVFAQLSIDQISNSLSSTSVTSIKKGKMEEGSVPNDFIHKATDLFIDEFKRVVEKWGVSLDNLNIFSMDFTDPTFRDALRDRAKQRMEADTNLANLSATTEALLGKTKREAEQTRLKAQAEANSIMTIAAARAHEANELSKNPLAAQLAILNAQEKLVHATGNNTMFIPHNISLDNYGVTGNNGQTFWLKQNQSKQNRLESNVSNEENETMTARLNI